MDANSGEPWSEADISDLKNEVDHGRTIAETASFLCRDVYELRAKMKELGLTVVKKNVSARAIPIRQAPRRRRRAAVTKANATAPCCSSLVIRPPRLWGIADISQ
jgi:hypothetical protein